MKVLLVNDLPPGPGSGAEVHVELLAAALQASGDTVEVLWADRPHTGLGRALDVWDERARRRLARLMASFEPDVVHFHNVLRELSMAVLAGGRAVPGVLTLHDHRLLGSRDAGSGGPVHDAVIGLSSRGARRLTRRRMAAVISLNGEMTARLRAAGFRRVEQMELFVADPGHPGQRAGQGRDVVFAGRLAPDKGARTLAEAFARIAPEHPESRLVMAGEGPERPAIEALGQRMPGRIELLGQVPLEEVHALMSCARVVAVPSVQSLRAEGGPTTILEAAIRARPVITTTGVPLAALVERSDGGLVVPPGAPDALARALDQLLSDPDGASAAGERARADALANNTPIAVVPRLRALYGQLVRTTP